MKRMLVLVAMLLTAGCMNLYTRCPGTDGKIEDTYQSTKEMADWTLIVAFPQVLVIEGDRGLSWFNLITVPLSLVVFADDCCEAVGDTLCYPFDITRRKK
jgi:uncharacterized protein YceK